MPATARVHRALPRVPGLYEIRWRSHARSPREPGSNARTDAGDLPAAHARHGDPARIAASVRASMTCYTINARRSACPCDQGCPLRDECRVHWIACRAFENYVHGFVAVPRRPGRKPRATVTGVTVDTGVSVETAPVRKPTRTIFRELLPGTKVPREALRA